MKGLVYSGISLLDLDGDNTPEHDWYNEFATVLLAQQNVNGSWPSSPAYVWTNGNWGAMSGSVLSTIWALLTLEAIAPPPPKVHLDIKPGSCPNPVNTNTQGKGRIPMAILGTETFDVSEIDPASISIGGVVFPVRTPVIEDVGTPLLDGEECECHELEGDGIDDLLIHFSRREVLLALGLNNMPPGTVVPITVSGELLDGTLIEATDCVTLVPRSD
ncbi:MAG: hypothetical protein ACYTBZ_14430 [Planctomycetota bacterium]|jgi:hypothetical protein